MSKELIERLRNSNYLQFPAMAIEAADEIERLTAELAESKQHYSDLRDENDRFAFRIEQQSRELAALKAQSESLENIRRYAVRHRYAEWAKTILRFCTEAGCTSNPLRAAPQPAGAEFLDIENSRLRQALKQAEATIRAMTEEQLEQSEPIKDRYKIPDHVFESADNHTGFFITPQPAQKES